MLRATRRALLLLIIRDAPRRTRAVRRKSMIHYDGRGGHVEELFQGYRYADDSYDLMRLLLYGRTLLYVTYTPTHALSSPRHKASLKPLFIF